MYLQERSLSRQDGEALTRVREVLLQVRQEIRFKLFLAAFCISSISVLASGFLILTLQKQQMVEETQQATAHLNDVIEAGLQYGMLKNDWGLTNEIIQSQVEASQFSRIRILNAEGVVRASSNPADIGRRLDKAGPTCIACHDQEGPAGQTSIVRPGDGPEILWDVNLIHNRQECQGCHDPQQALLGLQVVERPLTGLPDQMLGVFWRILIAGAVTFGLMMGMMMFAAQRWVVKPVRAITGGVSAITAGDLDSPVAPTGQDELGRVVTAFDRMRRQLKASQSEMERRNRDLALLNDIALNTGQMLDPQQIMDLALETVVDRLGMHAGFIRLYDEELDRFTLRAARGVPRELCEQIEERRMGPGPDISQRVIETGQAVIIPDMSADRRFSEGASWSGPHAYINLPIKSRGAVIGTLVLWAPPGYMPEAQNLETLEAVGHEVGIAIDNALLLTEAQEREAEARSQYRLVAEISGSLEMPEVLQAIAAGACQFLSADLAWVGLYDEDRETIEFDASGGAGGEPPPGLSVPFNLEWQDCCLKNTHALNLPDVTADHGLFAIREALARAGVASILTAPLTGRSGLQGIILAATHHPRYFRQKDIQRMERLVQRVSQAVENARLHQKVSYMATLEERERLAREMHDSLAQALGYLHFQASVTDRLLRENRVEQAMSSLQEMKQVSHATYTDVREAIFNLRVALASGLRFLPTLEEYVHEYHRYYGLSVHLSLDGVDLSCFSPDVDIQLLRIIQEALTNVRKHAQAGRVDIRFQKDTGWVKILIEDDGCGFDPACLNAEGRSSFGLQIMRERAEGVGGALELVSAPGQGTQVVVLMPFNENNGGR